jgi:hypothetical protein
MVVALRGSMSRDERARAAALQVLQGALERCQDEDIRTPELFAALDLLAAGAREQWPFDQFRRSLRYEPGETGAAAVGRWQHVNASLNAIRRIARIR